MTKNFTVKKTTTPHVTSIIAQADGLTGASRPSL